MCTSRRSTTLQREHMGSRWGLLTENQHPGACELCQSRSQRSPCNSKHGERISHLNKFWGWLPRIYSKFHSLQLHLAVLLFQDLFAGALHAKKAKEILHFDFLYMGKSLKEFWYFLLLRDDFSSYSRLVPCNVANAGNAEHAISDWISIFHQWKIMLVIKVHILGTRF